MRCGYICNWIILKIFGGEPEEESLELREDGGEELREDGGEELREIGN